MAQTKKAGLGTQGGTSAIDAIRQSYMGERRCVTIPEWKWPKTGEPMDLWFGPITPSDMEKVDAHEPKTMFERQLLLLVATATDEGGKPLFEFGHRKHLMDTTEFSVLQRVFDFMLASWLDKDEAEKKIKDDPTSAGDSNSQSG